ncbi:small glutamine-rich tetratricopeptide repeat-containing protein alpha-like [Tubulanus polymorphus]|uniref:small glutamine-rich tetratricopeptide repeat-containing protein alpha-like n=1 Tax=Tubulanus polymorphus TaxID=672921 RepID=UPI003DA46D1A
MAEKKQLVFSIIKFLDDEITSGKLGDDATESLEVARQCLETAYGVSLSSADYQNDKKLIDIFTEAMGTSAQPQKIPTLAEKAEAEQRKQEGNDLMKADKYMEAMNLYTQALDLDPTNAVYYCNRAAAHSKLGNHKAAIDDCRQALDIEPDYSKAYGRMGLAYTACFEYENARECYKRASELDPGNETYHMNLRAAEQKLEEINLTDTPSNPPAGMGGLDFSALMSNPSIMSMAQNLMSRPEMQDMMTGLLQNAGQGESGAASGMGNLFRTTYQLAQQMQQQNPELVNQLRTQMNENGSSSSNDPNNQGSPENS